MRASGRPPLAAGGAYHGAAAAGGRGGGVRGAGGAAALVRPVSMTRDGAGRGEPRVPVMPRAP